MVHLKRKILKWHFELQKAVVVHATVIKAIKNVCLVVCVVLSEQQCTSICKCSVHHIIQDICINYSHTEAAGCFLYQSHQAHPLKQRLFFIFLRKCVFPSCLAPVFFVGWETTMLVMSLTGQRIHIRLQRKWKGLTRTDVNSVSSSWRQYEGWQIRQTQSQYCAGLV